MEQQDLSFASNGKVSIRQMRRMMFLELFGLGTLILPGPLARICQTDGVFAILTAAVIWGIILRCACGGKMDEDPGSPPEEQADVGPRMDAEERVDAKARMDAEERVDVGPRLDAEERADAKTSVDAKTGRGQVTAKIKAVFQIAFFAAAAGFMLYTIASLVERQLLDSNYLWIIVFTILFAGGYGIIKGVECRARIYEILFWILMAPLAVILLIALWNVNPDYWLPVFSSGCVFFLLGAGFCFVVFLPAGLCLLLRPACAEPERVGQMGAKVVMTAGICCALVYLLMLGIFQQGLLSVLKYPIISLMSVVQLPGNLMERLDAPMVTIWFFCLFALFHSLSYYCVEGIKNLFPRKKYSIRNVVTGMILILIIGLLLLLQGCGKKGPEENMFPLAVGIEEEKDTGQMVVSYAMPAVAASSTGGGQPEDSADPSEDQKLSREETNSDKGSEGDNSGDELSDGASIPKEDELSDGTSIPKEEELSDGISIPKDEELSDGISISKGADIIRIITADSLFQAQELISRESDKTLDLNHMKVFVINREILRDEKKKEQLYTYFLENDSMAWNTCLLLTEEKMENLFCADVPGEKSIGYYMEDLLKSRQDVKDQSVFTVKDYMSLYQNQTETMLVPVISLADGQLAIEKYCIVSRGGDRGTLSVTDGMYVQTLLGNQKTLSLLLEEDAYVTMRDIRLERKIYADDSGSPVQKILIKGNLELSADWLFSAGEKEKILEEARERIEAHLNGLIQETKTVNHADVTNSFLALSGYNRILWRMYRDNPDAYEKKLETTVEVRLKLLET